MKRQAQNQTEKQTNSNKMSSYLNNITEVPIQNSSESYRLNSLGMIFPEQCVCNVMAIKRKNEGYIIIPGNFGKEYRIKKSSLSNRVTDVKSNAVPMKYILFFS
jgi:hypothetical protein